MTGVLEFLGWWCAISFGLTAVWIAARETGYALARWRARR